MVKVKIQAGLGNQMFQYALARAIQEYTGEKVVLDLSFYNNGIAKGDTPREFSLDRFEITESLARDYTPTKKIDVILEKIFRRIRKESPIVFYKKYLHPKERRTLIGFWQTEKYFQGITELIKKDFTLKNKIENREDTDLAKQYLEKIENSKVSISVNVRRGDYVNNPKIRQSIGLLTKDYFIEGVKYISQKLGVDKSEVNIFIVSDDIVWCKENLKDLTKFGNLIFVPPEISPEDTIILMSKCQHNVVANSTFAWWGAWLNTNPEKIVVAPKQWMRDYSRAGDIVPASWVKLENRFY